MPSKDEIRRAREQLATWRRSLEGPFRAAEAAGDRDEAARLTAIAKDIDAVLDELALLSLGQIAASLKELAGRIDVRREAAAAAGADFGGASLAAIKQAIEEIFARSSEEEVPAAEAVEELVGAGAEIGGDAARPVARGAEPAPSAPGTSRAEPDLAEVGADFTVAAPADGAGGRLVLTEAHLVALWKRSQFPIDGRGVILFGLRGCRPVDLAGTGFLPSQEIVMSQVEYRTMRCTLGQWRPGKGIALFPGSTAPFGLTVQAGIARGGEGVNQMGCGRYRRYVAGWHKRREGTRGHWAMLQDCAITLQRTANDASYDLADRWMVGNIAGDNIHCAFNLGGDGGIPDVSFSSAGCQVVAGTVKKGEHDSARGPWRRFMEPFSRELGGQKSAEYVLLTGEEAQTAIRARFEGKTILLRFGSVGPWVADLQAALNARQGAELTVNGDFDERTFQAVLDFQSQAFGTDADDGIVGGITAQELGLTLPAFDFQDAISGGPGYRPHRSSAPAAPRRMERAEMVAPVAAAGDKIAWGAVVGAKHGPGFKPKVIEIAARLGCDPNHLMAVMAFETGESFAPDKKNAAGSGATGLIQFMPATAAGLGTSTDKLARMTGVEQLDFVEKHFRSVARNRPLVTLSDVYMAVLLPSAVGKLESHVLFAAPSTAYEQNKGLDVDKNGRITKAEAAAKVQAKLVLGMRDNRFG